MSIFLFAASFKYRLSGAIRRLGGEFGVRWSRANFETLLKLESSEERVDAEPMFSWLNTKLPDYPDTLGLKLYAHTQEPGMRPHFELEPSDHPLSQEYPYGIQPERVREIMLRELKDAGQQSL